ncbi:Crp/Fnr family transcriptional regulator [Roseivirga sp.]|uniref:Crp/Fnr family transcriptional regulator n=1 Tax=Roseivirga sp. TaxID=1964215 RepID=UPI003B5162A4
MEVLLDYISQFVKLADKEANMIKSELTVKDFPTGYMLLNEGEVSTRSYFNLSGLVRRFHCIDGEERTTCFYKERQFIASFRSFHAKVPSDHFLECLEPVKVIVISDETEKRLLESIPKIERFARIVLEQEVANYQDMFSTYILKTAEQRYLKLLREDKELLQRIPLKQLATYIGVQPESLSRIRKRIALRSS